ncbi:MAG TPA: tRNA (adenosine(37)-N6)-threonylcarbamoyltransferase complex dimerization subunit type 1 TsaB [Pirellulales bacterium]|nr:tRNA (adenosine(37)-N6)-threonylcarbamoyltransferase complex dimerization subunit type 1 TsaB [Pirellulales bacterium]
MAPRILALETSGQAGSVALLTGAQVVCERVLPAETRSAQSLAPAIRAALDQAGWKPPDVQVVAVTIGPGSFTGLRVGATTAKTFAYATGAAVLGIGTLDCIAAQAPGRGRLSAVIDAYRRQVFTRTYQCESTGTWLPLDEPHILDDDRWLASLANDTRVSGPGLERLVTRLPADTKVAPRETWTPRAATVGALAYARYTAGQRDDLWTLAPAYLRRSAAEEKADEK